MKFYSVVNEINRVLKPGGYVVISVQKLFGRKDKDRDDFLQWITGRNHRSVYLRSKRW